MLATEEPRQTMIPVREKATMHDCDRDFFYYVFFFNYFHVRPLVPSVE